MTLFIGRVGKNTKGMETIMNNKYDVTLTDDERQQLKEHIQAITKYLIDLVKNIATDTTFNVEWSYYDNVWGKQIRSIEIENRFNKDHKATTTIGGKMGGLTFIFERDLFIAPVSDLTKLVYPFPALPELLYPLL